MRSAIVSGCSTMLVAWLMPGHHVRDGQALGLGEFGRIDRLPAGRRLHQVEQRGRPGEAADVRGADAIGAALHDS
jgi:hypothetical protein